jgi:phospholipase C
MDDWQQPGPPWKGRRGCVDPTNPACTNSAVPDVMGYHDAREIPNYWTYASDFVLQDHMFEPNASWSLPQHVFMVSEWSAACSRRGDPQSCVNALQNPGTPARVALGATDAEGDPVAAQLRAERLTGWGEAHRDGVHRFRFRRSQLPHIPVAY